MRIQGYNNDGSSAVENDKKDVSDKKNDYYSERKKMLFQKEMNKSEVSEQKKDDKKKDNDLSSMFSSFAKQASSMTSGSSSVGQTSQTAMDRSELSQLCQSLVDKILVSQPRLDGAHQVMLALNNSVLANTNITLTRDVNGMLFVNIVSSDPMSYKKLCATKDMLEAELDSHEKNAFRVEITFDGVETAEVDNQTQNPKTLEDYIRDGDRENG